MDIDKLNDELIDEKVNLSKYQSEIVLIMKKMEVLKIQLKSLKRKTDKKQRENIKKKNRNLILVMKEINRSIDVSLRKIKNIEKKINVLQKKKSAQKKKKSTQEKKKIEIYTTKEEKDMELLDINKPKPPRYSIVTERPKQQPEDCSIVTERPKQPEDCSMVVERSKQPEDYSVVAKRPKQPEDYSIVADDDEIIPLEYFDASKLSQTGQKTKKMKIDKRDINLRPAKVKEYISWVEEPIVKKGFDWKKWGIIGIIISAIIAFIISIITFVFWPLTIFARWYRFEHVEQKIDDIKSPLDFEKYVHKHEDTLISQPRLTSGKKGKKCDVWRALQYPIIRKGYEIYNVETMNDLIDKSITIKSIISKCGRRQDPRIHEALKNVKLRGKKRTGLQWILGR